MKSSLLTLRSTRKHAALALTAGALAACSVGPTYKRPEVPVPETFKEASADGVVWKKAQPADVLPRGPWWENFQDPLLNSLTAQVEVSNENLKNTVAKYYQAAALVSAARAAYFPTANLNATETRARNAISGINQPTPTTTDTLSVSASSWELDLWGRIRDTVDANELAAVASVANIENLKLSLQAQLAQSYFSLRVADAQIDLLNRTVADYQKALELTNNRFKGGVASQSDVSLAETQLKSTQAQAIDATIARAQFEHAIAVLIGKAPADFSIMPQPLAAKFPDIPLTVPSQLLERRPDIAAAERSVASANAQIGAAQAALFPALTLSATVGYRQNSWGNIIALANRFWSVGPAVGFTLFDGGLKRSQIAQAQAIYEQNVATYRQTVLSAFQDVEDNLVTLRVLEQEAVVQAEAVAAANESLKQAIAQYRGGIVNYLNVITAQTAALTNRNAELSVMTRRLTAAVGLYKALGGGYEQKAMKAPPVPPLTGLQLKRAEFLQFNK